MALKSTIFKVQVSISDLDRHYYAEHALTLARHPSETDERLMLRLLAFMLFADERLEFGKGLSSVDEPDLLRTDYGGDIVQWIEVGLPDQRAVKRALSRAEEVVVLAYGGQAARLWWDKEGPTLGALAGVRVLSVTPEDSAALTALCERSMQMQCTVQDGELWLNAGRGEARISPQWREG